MTTPERIWVWENKDPIGSSHGWNTVPHDTRTEYVRRDPAVLAALPEVQAMMADALDAAAKEIDERGGREQADFGLGREAQNFYRARDLIRAIAAAIREGRA